MPANSFSPDFSENARVMDLHLHSNASDGSDPPRRVVDRAKEAGLRVISLTDHDTVDGLEEGRREAERLGLEFVNGIELSSVHEGRLVHILGHFIQPEVPAMSEEIARYRKSRRVRMDRIIERLGEMGLAVDPEDFYRKYDQAGSIGRGQLSAYMLENNLVNTREEAFRRYIGEDGPAYVELEMVSPARAVEIIIESGGAATYAHPNLSNLDEIIPELAEAGLAGIEMDHPSQSEEVRHHYGLLAARHGLVEMGGSDCHGVHPGAERMGKFNQPLSAYSALRERARPEGGSPR
jgi:predicted metal-dependent phosphoesterase TrpH